MSPTPLYLIPSAAGRLLIGTIMRAMRLTLSVTLNGITGWKLRLK